MPLKQGRHPGRSPILERLPIDNYLTGEVDPFPYSDPNSTFDGTTGGATTGMLGNGPDPTVPNFGGAGNCVFAGYQHTCMRNSWLAGETKVGDLTLWPTSTQNLTAYFTYQGSPHPGDFQWSQDNGYDNGCDEGAALLWFTENKVGDMPLLELFAGVPTEGQFFQGAIGAFGVFFDGILVSSEMMQDSEQDPIQPWDQTATDWEGGHCAPVIFRSPEEAKYDTWNLVQPGDWANWRTIREDGAVLFTASIANAPTGYYHGVAVKDLRSDIQKLKPEFPVSLHGPERREQILATATRGPSIGQLIG